jgi:hypothetical protein
VALPQPDERGSHPEDKQADDGKPRHAADRERGQVVRQHPRRSRRGEARRSGTG